MTFLNKNQIKSAAFSGAFVLIAAAAVVLLVKSISPGLLPVLKSGNSEQIESYIRSSGTVGGLVCIAILQLIQVCSVVISGVPIQIAAGAVYGPVKGILVTLIASVAGLTGMLICWRRLGERLSKLFPVGEKQNKMMERFLSRGGSPFVTVLLACLIPVLPNGLIPLLASKTEVTVKQFVGAVTIGVTINVCVCVSIGDKLASGDTFACIALALLLCSLALLLWKEQDRLVRLEKKLSNIKFRRFRKKRFGHNN